MTLRQLLLTGRRSEIKQFFKGVSQGVFSILVGILLQIRTYPEEMRTKEIFLEELKSLREDKDFSDFSPTIQKAFTKLSQEEMWEAFLDEATERIKSC